jgi:hypothetical protein
MRTYKLLPVLFLLTALLSSCGHSYSVDGTSSVSYMDGKTLFLKVLKSDKWVNVDSAEVVHGTFKMNGSLDSVVVASLYMDDESLMPVVLESGSIKITISDTDMKASGTPLNDKLYEFIAKKNEMDLKLQDIDHEETEMVMNGMSVDQIHAELTRQTDSLSTAMNAYVKQFISDNYKNALGPSVFMMLCSGMPYPAITPQIEEILKDAPDTFKNNPLVSEFITKAHENAQLMMEQQRVEQNEANRSAAGKNNQPQNDEATPPEDENATDPQQP